MGYHPLLLQGLTDSLVVVNWKLSWFGMRTRTLCIDLNQHGQWFHMLNHLWFLQCHWASIQKYQTNPHPEQQNMSLTGCIDHIRTVLQVSVGMLSCSLLCRLETQTLRSVGTSYCGRCSLWSCPTQYMEISGNGCPTQTSKRPIAPSSTGILRRTFAQTHHTFSSWLCANRDRCRQDMWDPSTA